MKTAFGGLLAVAGLMVAGVANAQPAGAVPGLDSCSPDRFKRTAEQTIREHIAAMEAGDWAKARCDYALDVVVQTDMGTFQGRDTATGGVKALLSMVGQLPNVLSISSSGPVVFITWNLLRTGLCVPDGTDTYVVERGQIKFQTSHALMTFCGG